MDTPAHKQDVNLPDNDSHSKARANWNAALPETLPRPTYWPLVLAFGIVLIPFGLITSLLITGIGLVIFIIGLSGWIGELLHES